MDIKKLIKKSRGRGKGERLYEHGFIFISRYDKWLEGVEANIKCSADQKNFFIDITDGVHRAFISTKKVGVWGGVPNNGYFLATKTKFKFNGKEKFQ